MARRLRQRRRPVQRSIYDDDKCKQTNMTIRLLCLPIGVVLVVSKGVREWGGLKIESHRNFVNFCYE